MEPLLNIAIQKSGRLHQDSLALLADCGIGVPSGGGKLKARASNFSAEVLFLRDDDIPQYVADGVADIGLVGRNVVLEKNKAVDVLQPLGFGKCRLSIAVREGVQYPGKQYLQGLRIATSYTNILSQFLKENNIVADVHEISGSVEIAPGVGMADAICDLVSSGSTLFMNGLKEVEVILQSEAVLVARKQMPAAKQQLLDQLQFRTQAVLNARGSKYVLLNAPNDKLAHIISILPGVKSPTVMPLALQGWSSLHSVINEKQFWEVIGKLKEAGAQGILVIPIEKMIV
jgi:ATP phosphoribosyltransferase